MARRSPAPRLLPVSAFFSPGDTVYLPAIRRRLPLLVHPALPIVEEENAAWIRHHLRGVYADLAILEKITRQSEGLWGCYLAPLVTTPVQVLITEWTTLLFVFDDMVSLGAEPEEMIAHLDHLMATGELSGTKTPLDGGITDLWQRTQATLPFPLVQRLREVSKTYFGALREENIYRRPRQLPEPEHMLAIRRDSIDLRFFFTFIEAGMGLVLSDADRVRTDTALLHALEHIALSNDLHSFRCEVVEGDYFSLIIALCTHENLTLQEGIDRLCHMIEESEDSFLASRAEILGSPHSPSVDAYLDALGYAMSGNHHWGYICTRYHGREHIWNGLKSGTLTLGSTETILVPGPDIDGVLADGHLLKSSMPIPWP